MQLYTKATPPMLSTLPFRFASPTAPLKRTNLLLSSAACGLSSRPPTSKMNTSTTMTSAESLPTPAAANSDSGEVSGEERRLVQYVVLRRDLIDTWPLGSVVTQGCHAAVAAVWAHRDHPDTQAYLAPQAIDEMHKVTLEVKGEAQLKNLAEKLEAAGVRHKLWIEQPENIATCVATAPCQKSQVASLFKKLKLCK